MIQCFLNLKVLYLNINANIGINLHKNLYESLIVKSNLMPSSMLNNKRLNHLLVSENKTESPVRQTKADHEANLKGDFNSSKSKNKNQQKISKAVSPIESNHHQMFNHHKSNSITSISNQIASHSKEKQKGLQLIKTDIFKKISKGGINININKQTQKQKQLNLIKSQTINLKKSIANVNMNSNAKNNKNKIEAHHHPTKTVVEVFSLLSKKTTDLNTNTNINCISRNNSISNLDKTSTEPTTTSKRLIENRHKLIININGNSNVNTKSLMKHNFNIQLNKELDAVYSNNFITIQGSSTKQKNKRNNNQLSTSLSLDYNTNAISQSKWYHNNRNTIDGNAIKTLITIPNKSQMKHKDASVDISKEKVLKNKRQNNNGSLSILSEDSAFNSSKYRSSSRQNKSNSIGNYNAPNQNDASLINQCISLKNSSNNTSKNYERKSKHWLYYITGLSKERSNSYGDATVSFTYSDDELADQSIIILLIIIARIKAYSKEH